MSNLGNDGECQLEVDFVDEGDLDGRYKTCLKNPGHKEFLSLTSLQFKDLHEHHRTPCTLDFIYHVAQFTVRLVVDFISPDRPCHCGQENTSQDRQCKCLRGNIRHVGSGLVTGLAGPDELTPDMRDSTKTYFMMVTAAHVIFDTSEAQKTEIEFFYDDPHDRSTVRKAFGLRVLNTNLEADFSEVLCLTEDHVISGKLNNPKFKRKLSDEIRLSLIRSPSDSFQKERKTSSQDFTFHISHPHGTSKKVTLGNIVSADTRQGHYQLIYSLATCRGSSGGPVCVIPENIYITIYKLIIYKFRNLESIFSVPHARHHDNNLNSSSSWTLYFSDHVDLMDEPELSVETEKHFKQKIVLLNSLDIEDLPLGCRFYHTLHLIKNISKFTVAIHVLNDATFDSKNMASGFVTRLANNDDIRPDLEDTTKTYFIMVTAAHVISVTSQAKETEINFFCDDLQDMSSVRKALGWRVLKSDKETNVSEVLCFTTDHVISSMLKEHFLELSPNNIQNVGSSMSKEHFVVEFTTALKKCLTHSLFCSVVSRDFDIQFEERKDFLVQVYMSLETAFERLVLITLLLHIHSFGPDILLSFCEEAHNLTGSLTFKSYVLKYVMLLFKYVKEKTHFKDTFLCEYVNKNKMNLIECIKNTSKELYCEMILGERQRITFQISHHGKKEIFLNIPYLTDDMRETKRCGVHDDSPVFTILRDLIDIDDISESNVSIIAFRLYQSDLYQSIFDWSDKKLKYNRANSATISFPCCDTGTIHRIRFWERYFMYVESQG